MRTELSQYFWRTRLRKGIRLGDFARRIGYRNVSKGASRIDKFEKFGEVHEGLLLKLAAALGIDNETVAMLIEEDRQRYVREWERWASIPIEPYVVLANVGGFTLNEPLPPTITSRAEAEAYASGIARKMKRRILLVLSRRLSIGFAPEGNRTRVNEAKPGQVTVPYLRPSGSRRTFLFDARTGTIRIPTEPKKPQPQEVVSDLGGIRMKSSFTVVEGEPGQVSIDIKGPTFEFDEETKPCKLDLAIGLDMVLQRHGIFHRGPEVEALLDSLDQQAIETAVSEFTQIDDRVGTMLRLIEDGLLKIGVVKGEKKFQ